MTIGLGENSYGKSRIRMMKLRRDDPAAHELVDVMVDVRLEGDFAAAHERGDNSLVLPTDTMKNTVYALGKTHPLQTIESFALDLANHFVGNNRQVSAASVSIVETVWDRMQVDGTPHPHCFAQASSERRTCSARRDASGAHVQSGSEQLTILKTAASAFSGFPRDAFTTLKETEDRLLGTELSTSWTYSTDDVNYAAARDLIRSALLNAFASHESRSVQHTLHAMGSAALQRCREINQITLRMPNKHCLLVDLSPFGMTNENEIFLPIDEPHGMIEATLHRA